jgi:hypothetical protein
MSSSGIKIDANAVHDTSTIRQLPALHWLTLFTAVILIYVAATALGAAFRPGLRKLPGPLFARFTRLSPRRVRIASLAKA